nr:transposase [Moorena bouillonii]
MPHRRESQILRDLSDTEWEVLKPLLPEPIGFGHPRTVDLREILNGVFYVHWTGCQWEMLPHDLPPVCLCIWLFPEVAATPNMAENS